MNEKLKQLMKENPLYWGKYYVGEHFRDQSPKFHLIILRESMKNRYFAVAAPRESAKSTILTFLRTLHGVCLEMFRFIVIAQNTYAKASESLNAVKMEIKENEQVKREYRIKITRDATGDSIFLHPNGFKTRVLCKGLEQIGSVRGEKFGAYRPDLIIIDDLEDDIMVKNPELRQNLHDQFDQALIPAGQRGVCQYLAIGTILHDDSLMARLVSKDHYPEWRKLLFKALWTGPVNGVETSLWPEKWTVEDLKKMRNLKPDVFAKEYQNDPVSGLMAKFHKEDFRYWHIEEGLAILKDNEGHVVSKYALTDCRAAISCDLAIEEKRSADATVIMPGLLTPNSDILIDDYISEKGMEPNIFENYIFQMVEKYRAMTGKNLPIGFEKGALQKFMLKWLARAERERNKFLWKKDLKWEKDKNERIVGHLGPRYRAHTIYHKGGMGELEHQLRRVPSGTHDDLADAAQGLVQLLQYAPSKKKAEENLGADPGFEWLRKHAVKKKVHKKQPYIFGKKTTKLFEVPAKKGWR